MSWKIEERFRGLLRVSLALLLISPYLIWLWRISDWTTPDKEWWWRALQNSLLQALVSALLSMVGGALLFCALQSWSRKAKAEVVLLFPNAVPALFVALSLLSLGTWGGRFPYGWPAVIFAHVLINCGLVAVALDRLVQFRVGRMAEAALVLGVKRGAFWRRVGWPELRRDLVSVFLFIFSLCVTSFSLPLLLSGERVLTIEVAIYDAIRVEGRWDTAVLLAISQALLLFVLAWLVPGGLRPPHRQSAHLALMIWSIPSFVVWLPTLILLVGWLIGLGETFYFGLEADYLRAFSEAVLTTLALGVMVGWFLLLLFLLTAFVSPHSGLDRFLNGYLAPSPAITGFGLLLLPFHGDLLDLIKLALALALVFFPLLYRWLAASAITSLREQVMIGRTLGAGWGKLLVDVVWPQAAPFLLRASGLGALWASADFALSGILLDEASTLPLLIEDLVANYHLPTAQLLLLPLLLCGAFVYFLFAGASRYVAR